MESGFASPPTEIMDDQTLSGEERAETLMALLRDERNAMRIIVAAARKLKQEKEDLQAERDDLIMAAEAGREAVARAQGAEDRIRMLEALLAEERSNPSAEAKERVAALELLLRDERQAMVILVEASDSLRAGKDQLTAEKEALQAENERLKARVDELQREGTHPAMEHMWRVSTGPDSAGVAYRKTANFDVTQHLAYLSLFPLFFLHTPHTLLSVQPYCQCRNPSEIHPCSLLTPLCPSLRTN